MTKNTSLANSTSLPASTRAKASAADRIVAVLGNEAIKSDAAQRAADTLLARGIVAWLATQSDADRAAIFVAVEATLSQSDCRKIAIHKLRPQIDPALIDAARENLAAAEAEARAEKQRAADEAKRQRKEDRRARQEQKDAAERARYEALRAKFEDAEINGSVMGEE